MEYQCKQETQNNSELESSTNMEWITLADYKEGRNALRLRFVIENQKYEDFNFDSPFLNNLIMLENYYQKSIKNNEPMPNIAFQIAPDNSQKVVIQRRRKYRPRVKKNKDASVSHSANLTKPKKNTSTKRSAQIKKGLKEESSQAEKEVKSKQKSLKWKKLRNRPNTSFVRFYMEHREIIRSRIVDNCSTNITKEAAQMWKSLPQPQKDQYNALAKKEFDEWRNSSSI